MLTTLLRPLIRMLLDGGVSLDRATARAVGEMLRWWRQFPKTQPPSLRRKPKAVGSGSFRFPAIVVQKLARWTNGKIWLRCKAVSGTSNYYDPDSPDIIAYGGIDNWYTCGDELYIERVLAAPQGDEPYPSDLVGSWLSAPVDQVTLDEPQSACIVASPVPCIADPPEPDPCIAQPEP